MNDETFLQRYRSLNEQQREAVDTLEGPVLVVAGPGSGKTELLSLRVANILRQTDAEPSSIICLTFTDAAAVNMRQRLAGLIGPDAYRVAIYTFHGFGTDIINRHPQFFYEGASFRAADELRQRMILTDILEALPYNHPLRSTGPDGTNVYLRDIISAIGYLKKSGLRPEDFLRVLEQNADALQKINPLMSVFDGTMSLKIVPQVEEVMVELVAIGNGYEKQAGMPTLPSMVALQLKHALDDVGRLGKATPLSEWKSKRLVKNDNDGRILKDTQNLDKNLGLAEVYAAYQEAMREQRYFDFDDMLLDVLQALERHDELRYELQEQFQYILVDEFQDTNNAQMRVLEFLTDSPFNEGKPNIMAVGDDDQAVYKFQGAEIGGILDYRRNYPEAKIVVLTRNYRSTQPVLDSARQVIVRAQVRLENTIEEIEKELVAANSALRQGEIEHRQYASLTHELYGVARQIKACIDKGTAPEDIAVISKQRKYLEQLLPYLYKEKVPVRYDRQQDVLQEPHIHQLVQMARFAVSVARRGKEADELLPEILSYPFWELDRTSVWRLSRQAYELRRSWLDVMMDGDDEALKQVGEFLISLADSTKHEPVDVVLELMMGAHEALVAEDESDDTERDEQPKAGFVSPFKEYYFSRHKFDTERSEYLRFLSALKTFVQTVHEHGQDKVMTAEDMVALVDIHMANGLALIDTSPYITGEKSVQLLTAHGAKGLEFESVFIISCQQSSWAKDGGYSKLSPPLNVPLSALANEEDDFLRLFYVALTRAKRNLYLSSHAAKDDGKEDETLSYVADWPKAQQKAEDVPTVEALDMSWRSFHAAPVVEDEQVLLLPLVEQYKMSVTHFNNFLDVSRGGPQLFLEQNLLRFPEPQSVQAAYGSAVHKAIQQFYLLFKRDGVLPELDILLELFAKALRDERLGQKDFDDCLARGRDELTLYYDARSGKLQLTDEVEFNFADQQVMIGNACLTGKIDRIVKLDDRSVSVHDIKTGKPKGDWRGADARAKVTLHKYRYQLQFYKLLIEHSRRFGGKAEVKEAMLEFVEPLHGQFVELPLAEADLMDGEMERLKQLIVVVYDHIQQLNFPDTSDYSADLKGVEQFEEDLLEGRI